MLAERIDTWNQQLREESLQQGVRQGQAETLLRLLKARLGSVDLATRRRISEADADLLLQWVDRYAGAESLDDIFHE